MKRTFPQDSQQRKKVCQKRISRILEHREKRDGSLEFLVEYKGEGVATWETADAIGGDPEFSKYEQAFFSKCTAFDFDCELCVVNGSQMLHVNEETGIVEEAQQEWVKDSTAEIEDLYTLNAILDFREDHKLWYVWWEGGEVGDGTYEPECNLQTNVIFEEFRQLQKQYKTRGFAPRAPSKFFGVYWNHTDRQWDGRFCSDNHCFQTSAKWSDTFCALKLNTLCAQNGVSFLPNPSIGTFKAKQRRIMGKVDSLDWMKYLKLTEIIPLQPKFSKFRGVSWSQEHNAWVGTGTVRSHRFRVFSQDSDRICAILLNVQCKKCGIDLRNPDLKFDRTVVPRNRKKRSIPRRSLYQYVFWDCMKELWVGKCVAKDGRGVEVSTNSSDILCAIMLNQECNLRKICLPNPPLGYCDDIQQPPDLVIEELFEDPKELMKPPDIPVLKMRKKKVTRRSAVSPTSPVPKKKRKCHRSAQKLRKPAPVSISLISPEKTIRNPPPPPPIPKSLDVTTPSPLSKKQANVLSTAKTSSAINWTNVQINVDADSDEDSEKEQRAQASDGFWRTYYPDYNIVVYHIPKTL